MPIKFRCQHCRQFLGISRSKAGEIVDCPTCGRSVRVPDLEGRVAPLPPPKMNLEDANLVNALDALARLSGGVTDQSASEDTPRTPGDVGDLPVPKTTGAAGSTGASGSTGAAGDDATRFEPVDNREFAQPSPPQGTEVPIVLPPSEPIAPPDRLPAAAIDAPPPVTSSTAEPPGLTSSSDAPPTARAADADHAHTLKSLAALAHEPEAGQPATASRMRWPILALAPLLAIGAFVAGVWLGPAWRSNTAPQQEPLASAQQGKTEQRPRDSEVTADNSDASTSRYLTGIISYRDADGSTRPDRGARIMLLPLNPRGAARIPSVGIRKAPDSVDFQIAQACLELLGGSLTVVGVDGSFQLPLPGTGEYHVLVLSHFQGREVSTALSPDVAATLEKYFDRGERVVGQLQFRLDLLRDRGAGDLRWDYTFERS